MDKELKSVIVFDRFITMLVSHVILSLMVVLLDTFALELKGTGTLLMLGVAMLVFFGFNIWRLRWSYINTVGNYKMYLHINITAYLIFAAINLMVALVLLVPGIPYVNTLYTWGFVITKFPKFALLIYGKVGIGNVVSAIIFHIVGLLCVAAAPLGVRIEEPEEEIPPMMELDDAENAFNQNNNQQKNETE